MLALDESTDFMMPILPATESKTVKPVRKFHVSGASEWSTVSLKGKYTSVQPFYPEKQVFAAGAVKHIIGESHFHLTVYAMRTLYGSNPENVVILYHSRPILAPNKLSRRSILS